MVFGQHSLDRSGGCEPMIFDGVYNHMIALNPGLSRPEQDPSNPSDVSDSVTHFWASHGSFLRNFTSTRPRLFREV